MTKHVLISGCSTGIGRACALHLASKGYHVFAGVRKSEDADSLKDADASGNVEPVMLDVTDEMRMGELKAELGHRLADEGLYGLVNNAGVGKGGPMEFVSPDLVRNIFEVNLMGPLQMTQAFLPLIRKATGRIVTIGSIAGKASAPIQGPYSISKFAVEAFNDSLRGELAPFGIHVSLVEPGPIATPMLQSVKERRDEVIGELPDHAKEWYRDQIEAISGYFHQMEQRALPPQAVADVVTHALEANRPKTRYLVTQDAKMTAFMKWLLPDRAFDAMGRRMMKS